jgi:predicted transport protein
MAISDIGRMNGMDMKSLAGMKGSKEPAEIELELKVGELEGEEDGMYQDMSPVGRFSKGALNSLVSVHNQVSKMFGMKPYASFEEDQESFPGAFTKEISMIIDAADDAAEAEVIGMEMVPSLENITTDKDVALLSGKIGMLAKSKDFKKFLAEPREEEEEMPEAEMAPAEGEMSEADMDKLFSERM